ncbi:MAG: exodeoxyribonuclease VII small subunit [Dehalococcoidia bacterium]|jgi:exodeoxyribonuclease VII small subunit|nr:exodeoxyribonuclease VII small subunit [Dehalococcoidia bacterium]|tara:strand:- start:129 stop:386 length:258 start_codon:yes stop_codon:yes gene_type:complete
MSNAKNSGELSFEEAYSGLEETVRALEEGGLSLAEATHLFEEGMRLARLCNEHLSFTELRITRLQTAFGEQMCLLTEEKEESAED